MACQHVGDGDSADVLVEFSPESPPPFEDYFRFTEALEELFGRPGNLATPASLENSHCASSVARTAVEVDAA